MTVDIGTSMVEKNTNRCLGRAKDREGAITAASPGTPPASLPPEFLTASDDIICCNT